MEVKRRGELRKVLGQAMVDDAYKKDPDPAGPKKYTWLDSADVVIELLESGRLDRYLPTPGTARS